MCLYMKNHRNATGDSLVFVKMKVGIEWNDKIVFLFVFQDSAAVLSTHVWQWAALWGRHLVAKWVLDVRTETKRYN